MAAVPAFADIGKAAREVLVGGKEGVYNFDQKFAVSTSTADGVSLNFLASKKGEKADLVLRTAYNYQRYGLSAILNTTDKVAVTASVAEVAPGLKATLMATLPDASSGKLALDFANRTINLKGIVGLTSSPKVDVFATTVYKNILLGSHVGYDTAKSEVSGYTAALSYTTADAQYAALLEDRGETLRLLANHSVSKTLALAAEVSRPVAGGDVTFALGGTRRLENGALLKAKMDNQGLLSTLYSQKLGTGEKVTLSGQVDTLNPGAKAPKVGVAIEM